MRRIAKWESLRNTLWRKCYFVSLILEAYICFSNLTAWSTNDKRRMLADREARYRVINFVIMDYLISEGYPRAAEKFAKEANIQLPVEEESIQSRVEIRKAIHSGDIDTAINKINDLNPQVCLCFVLLSRRPRPTSLFCYDYIQFHAPRIATCGSDDKQTFSPQYDSAYSSLSVHHISMPSTLLT